MNNALDYAPVAQRDTLLERIFKWISISILAVFALFFVGMIALRIAVGIAFGDRVQETQPSAHDLVSALGTNWIEWTSPLANARSASSYGGFHGDGLDWYAGTVSKDVATQLVAKLNSAVALKKRVHKVSTYSRDFGMSSAPLWWDPHSHSDLEAFSFDGQGCIAISPSAGKIYFYTTRT